MCYVSGVSGIWMAAGGLLLLGLWVAVIGLGAWGFWRLTRGRQGEHEALAVASERYARGEIGRDEFERIKKDLS